MVAGKAPGKDAIYPEYLKLLGPIARRLLTLLATRCMQTGYIPSALKLAELIPLLKPGKKADDTTSFRPVALCSCVCKYLEVMMLGRLRPILEGKLHESQHGFRPGRQTTDVLHRIAALHADAKAKGMRLYSVLVDFSKAFDVIEHGLLLEKLRGMGVPEYIIAWVRAFLTDRSFVVRVGSDHSSERHPSRGVPQGSILGPVLFLVYVDGLMRALATQGCAEGAAYADDVTLMHQAKTTHEAAEPLQRSLRIIEKWCKENFMQVNVTKTVQVVMGCQARASQLSLLHISEPTRPY